MIDNEKPAGTTEPEIEAELPLPEQKAEAPEPGRSTSRLARFRSWYSANKKKSIPLTIAVLLLLIFGIPFTRYKVAGLVLKKNFELQVMDATANTPVSGAFVSSGTISSQTDGNGKVRLKLAVGPHTMVVSKKYYQDTKANLTVPILSQRSAPVLSFTATGRQVKINVSNIISQQKVENVKIKVLDIEAKTDKNGSATVVLPAGIASSQVSLSGDGYNDYAAALEISDKAIKENNYNLTPAGKIYFLSKKSGKIDVVKANLDGSDRQTILAGTGKEDDTGTVMLASRNWKYLALLSRRDSDLAKLYMIDTASDEATAIDEGNATFNLSGWSDSNFIYRVDRNNIPNWQPKAQALKSYSAQTKQIILLDQTKAEGTNDYDYARETYGQTYLVGKNVIYEKNWTNNYYNPGALNGRAAGIYSIASGGSDAQTPKTFAYQVPDKIYIYFDSFPNKPREIYYRVTEGTSISYYIYNAGKFDARDSLSDEFNKYFRAGLTTYLQSPRGSETIWTEPRDGRNTLLIGDQDGGSSKVLASLSDDSRVYAWYSDDYLLVSKKSSELYILPRSGVKDESQLLKVTDYHKPAQNFYGYGGGYGGI